MKKLLKLALALVLVVVIIAVIGASLGKNGNQATPAPKPAADWSADTAKQPERQRLIQSLCDKGVFKSVEYRDLGATIVVLPAFYALDFDAKQNFTSVVYAYLAAARKDKYVTVRLKDSKTGNQIGEHDLMGLVLDK